MDSAAREAHSMPWSEVSIVDQRREFVRLAMQEGVNRRELCRRFGIHPDTGYKWLGRWESGGELADRSRRPHASPMRTDASVEARVLAVRDAHPAWGARKIARCLDREGVKSPAFSTVHEILHRNGRIVAPLGGPSAQQRFEKPAPNLLWQMDFKGWVKLSDGSRCHPLTVLDDHSRYDLCLQACANEQGSTVQGRLELTFRRYGLPEAFFVDNGGPWGDSSGQRWTRFGVWLLKLGIRVLHSRPYHPQSRGKNERFHRTLKAEVFALKHFRNLSEVQRAFDAWRTVYNHDRPHEALDQEVPASRYRPSPRSMPERLPQVEYDEREIVRSVPTTKDYISFKARRWKVPQAFRGERVAIRPLSTDGQYGIFFAAHQIAKIDLTNRQCVGDVSEQVSVMSSD
jgi:transposase InsO family protein